MSADNWGICPKCEKNRLGEIEKAKKKAIKSYGKVPVEEYEKLLRAAQAFKPIGENLREDYEIRTDEEGIFTVSYGCSCSRCGFKFSFKHSEVIDLNIKEREND